MRSLALGLLLLGLLLLGASFGGAQEYPPLPEAFSSFGAAVSAGQVYVYGGHVAKTHTYSTEAVTGKFRRLNLAAPKAWEELPSGPGLQGLALVAHGDRVYRIGGMQPRNKVGEPADNVSTAACAAFNTKSGKWEPLPDMPEPRSSHDAAVLGDKIFVAGGWTLKGQGKSSEWLDTILVLDLSQSSPQWQAIKQPFRRRALNVAAFQGKLFVVGGMGEAGTERFVDIYDPKSNQWTKAAELPGLSRNGFSPAVCVSGDHLYVNPADGKLYRLSPKFDSWDAIGTVAQPRIVHRMVPAGAGELLVLGGASKTGNVARVELLQVAGGKQQRQQSLASGNSGHWAGFRGDGTGVTSARLPIEWSSSNVAWSVDLPGYGQSAPVVWQDLVFITAVEGAEKDAYHLVALSASTGKTLWKKSFPASQKVKMSTMVSRAAPTPLVDANGVYAFFEGGDVVALSHAGEPLWQRSLVKEYGEFQNNHGLGCSPAGDERAVYVLIDHKGPSYLLAIDKASGKNLWKAERSSRSSWSSPVAARVGGRALVLASSGGTVDCFDAATGKLLCSQEGLEGNNIPSACVHGDIVVVGASEGRMTKDVAGPARSNCGLRLVEKNGALAFEKLWQADKVLTSMCTPLVHHGCAYFVNKSGVLTCLDAATGKVNYNERLPESCWASAIASGEHVWFFGKSGVTTVVKTGPEFTKIAANTLWETPTATASSASAAGSDYRELDPLLYGVAAVDGTLFFRTGTKLYCVRK